MKVPVILIREGRGNEADGNLYSADVLRRALPKFEGVPSYLDHAPPGTPASQRIRAGTIRDVVLREIDGRAAICGTLHTSGDTQTHGLLRTARAYAAKVGSSKAYVGLSIAALAAGETVRESGAPVTRISDIKVVESVDIVWRAGCGGGLWSGGSTPSGAGEYRLREAAGGFRFRTTLAPEPPAALPDRTLAAAPVRIELLFDDEPQVSTFFPADPIGTLREAVRKIDGRFDFEPPRAPMTFAFSEESKR